jgi:hypothetical protein
VWFDPANTGNPYAYSNPFSTSDPFGAQGMPKKPGEWARPECQREILKKLDETQSNQVSTGCVGLVCVRMGLKPDKDALVRRRDELTKELKALLPQAENDEKKKEIAFQVGNEFARVDAEINEAYPSIFPEAQAGVECFSSLAGAKRRKCENGTLFIFAVQSPLRPRKQAPTGRIVDFDLIHTSPDWKNSLNTDFNYATYIPNIKCFEYVNLAERPAGGRVARSALAFRRAGMLGAE